MSTSKTLYEGMFLMGQSAGADLAGAIAQVREILDRSNAEVVSLNKWDERKLAYTIKGQKRGLFILALFRVEGVQIANIERDCNLSEQVIRVLMTRADHMSDVEIAQAIEAGKTSEAEANLRADEAETPAPQAAAEAAD